MLLFSLKLSCHILLFSPTPQLVGSGYVPAIPGTLRGLILMISQDQTSQMRAEHSLSEIPPIAFRFYLMSCNIIKRQQGAGQKRGALLSKGNVHEKCGKPIQALTFWVD